VEFALRIELDRVQHTDTCDGTVTGATSGPRDHFVSVATSVAMGVFSRGKPTFSPMPKTADLLNWTSCPAPSASAVRGPGDAVALAKATKRLDSFAFATAEPSVGRGERLLLWIVRRWATRPRYAVRQELHRLTLQAGVMRPCAVLEAGGRTEIQALVAIAEGSTGGDGNSSNLAMDFLHVVLVGDNAALPLAALRDYPTVGWRGVARQRGGGTIGGATEVSLVNMLADLAVASTCNLLVGTESAATNHLLQAMCWEKGWLECFSGEKGLMVRRPGGKGMFPCFTNVSCDDTSAMLT
jgi:hypothetical protein